LTIDDFLQAIIADPLHADDTWQVLADWLEDRDDSRAELVRLLHQPDYRSDLSPKLRDDRVRELLASGMHPVVPTITNSIGMKFAMIPAGTFLMGSPASEERHRDDEKQHEVQIARPFFMGVYPASQEEYERVVGRNPSSFSQLGGCKTQVKKLETSHFPVESVSHYEVLEFALLLSKLPEELQACRSYRLPTEAEWEYSCRGGATSSIPFHFGHSLSSTQANFNGKYPYGGARKGKSLNRTSVVGSYASNAFGLYDMHGNVWEWCQDHYVPHKLTSPDDCRVMRGGSWNSFGWYCRSAYRSKPSADSRLPDIGFRVVCDVRIS
jgi:uncharacterized protein (TIGR02996 family)